MASLLLTCAKLVDDELHVGDAGSEVLVCFVQFVAGAFDHLPSGSVVRNEL